MKKLRLLICLILLNLLCPLFATASPVTEYSGSIIVNSDTSFECEYKTSGYMVVVTCDKEAKTCGWKAGEGLMLHSDDPFSKYTDITKKSTIENLNIDQFENTCATMKGAVNQNGGLALEIVGENQKERICFYDRLAGCKISIFKGTPEVEIEFNCSPSRIAQDVGIDKSLFKNGGCPNICEKMEPGTSQYTNFKYWTSANGNCSSNNQSTDNEPITPPDPYKGVEKCEKGTTDEINYIVACGCIPANVADITSKVYYILRVIGPILLIIVGGVEMAKAVGTQDESAIEKAKKKLVNKAIAAAAIFLVFTLIKLGISIVRDQSQTVELYECLEYLLNGYKI